MEITSVEYNEAMWKYWGLVNTLPLKLQEMCPDFDFYLSPSNWSSLRNYQTGRDITREWVELSITGAQRYNQLQSPHARTLLAVYAAKKLPKK